MRTRQRLQILCLGLFATLAACGDNGPASPGPGGNNGVGGVPPIQTGNGTPGQPDPATLGLGANCTPATPTVVFQDDGERSVWTPRIAYSGRRYGLTWEKNVSHNGMVQSLVGFAVVDGAGGIAVPAKYLTRDPTLSSVQPPAITGLVDGFAVVWPDNRQGIGNTDVYLVRTDLAGNELVQTQLTTSGRASFPYVARPAFADIAGARPKDELAITWRDSRDYRSQGQGEGIGRRDVYFKVVGLDGSERVAERRITTDNSGDNPFSPVLTSADNQFALVWRDVQSDAAHTELFLTMIDGTGAAQGEHSLGAANGIEISAPDLVWTGGELGMVYSGNATLTSATIQFSRMTADGGLMASQQISSSGLPCTPTIAFNGEHYAAAWQDNCHKQGSRLLFALVGADGTPLRSNGESCTGSGDPQCGISVVNPGPQETAQYPEMIAADGAFAVTWMDRIQNRIYFNTVSCVK